MLINIHVYRIGLEKVSTKIVDDCEFSEDKQNLYVLYVRFNMTADIFDVSTYYCCMRFLNTMATNYS